MGNNPRPKKQHYVPRFYLEHFTDGDGMVWTYDSQGNDVRPATPLNTAVETNFYSIMDDEGGHNDEIEHWLQGVEGKASELYPKVLRGEKLEGQGKADFSVFVSSLYTRSPAMITAYAEFTGYMAQHLNDFVLASRARFDAMMDRYDADKGIETTQKQRDETFAFARDKSRYIIQVDKKRGLRALGVTDRLTEIFYDMTWVVFESPHQHLVTSDNPVIQVSPPDDHHPIYGDGGFLNKRANVSVPLSSSRMLGLAWMADAPKGVHRVPKEQGRLFNRQRAHFSERYLYASQRDAGIQALGQKYRKPGLRMEVSGMRELAPVEVKRNLSR
jgi:hypothetical protein